MAQLMVIPVDKETDAVLIVTFREHQPLIGYVTKSTLETYCGCWLTAHDCVRVVDLNIDLFEQILAEKSQQVIQTDTTTSCIRVELSDLRKAGH